MATILVVDDDCIIRNMIKQVLTLHRHVVTEASDGVEALDAVTAGSPPDLILMDLRMPRLGGADCARRLKTLYPSLRIVLMSGSFGGNDGSYPAGDKHLFAALVRKPFRIRDITDIVAYVLTDKVQEEISFLQYAGTVHAS